MITTLPQSLPALRGKTATDIRIAADVDLLACLGPIHLADRQMLYVITLNENDMLIDSHLAAIGSIDVCNLHAREIFRYALYDCASSIALVQNHPSGDPTPSWDEANAAEALREAGGILDIPIVEHVIVATGGWYNYADETVKHDTDDMPF